MEVSQQQKSLNFGGYAKFLDALLAKNRSLFAAAHRGISGNFPENSLSAFKHCIEQGIHLIELDLQRTCDGQLIVMHDITVNRMTDGEGQISKLTLSQIKSLSLKSGSGGSMAELTSEKIPTLSEVLALVKGKAMINLDKAWYYRDEIHRLVSEADAFDHVLLKSGEPVQEVKEYFHSLDKKFHYMHKIQDKNLDELDELLEHLSPLAIEILIHKENDNVLSAPLMEKLKNRTNLWCNSLDHGENAGHNDSRSLVNPDDGWGWLIDHGFNIIQTDYTNKLINYIEKRQ